MFLAPGLSFSMIALVLFPFFTQRKRNSKAVNMSQIWNNVNPVVTPTLVSRPPLFCAFMIAPSSPPHPHFCSPLLYLSSFIPSSLRFYSSSVVHLPLPSSSRPPSMLGSLRPLADCSRGDSEFRFLFFHSWFDFFFEFPSSRTCNSDEKCHRCGEFERGVMNHSACWCCLWSYLFICFQSHVPTDTRSKTAYRRRKRLTNIRVCCNLSLTKTYIQSLCKERRKSSSSSCGWKHIQHHWTMSEHQCHL